MPTPPPFPDPAWHTLFGQRAIVAPPPQRPHLSLVMVASLDGSTAEQGHVGQLSGPADQAFLLRMRETHDAVLVGASTVRVEGYDSLLGEDARARRRAAGKPAQPTLYMVSASLRIDREMPALAAADLPVVVITSVEADTDALAKRLDRQVDVIAVAELAPHRIDLAAAMACVRDAGIDALVCEGGPTLNGALLEQRLVDEILLVTSPRLSGPPARSIVGDWRGPPTAVELVASVALGGFVLSRYALAR